MQITFLVLIAIYSLYTLVVNGKLVYGAISMTEQQFN